MTAWGDSLTVLFDDLGRLAEALVGVERAFPRVRMRSSSRWFRLLPVRSLVMMARPRVVCTRSCRLWLGKVLMEANSE